MNGASTRISVIQSDNGKDRTRFCKDTAAEVVVTVVTLAVVAVVVVVLGVDGRDWRCC